MAEYHVVQQGEYLSKIAKTYGFENYSPIWDHPENARLKQKRKSNPNLLYPGDRIYIPDRTTREEGRSTDLRHSFKLNAKPLRLRVVLMTCDGQPRHNLSLVMNLDGGLETNLMTDSNGLLDRSIPRTASFAVLTFRNE